MHLKIQGSIQLDVTNKFSFILTQHDKNSMHDSGGQ